MQGVGSSIFRGPRKETPNRMKAEERREEPETKKPSGIGWASKLKALFQITGFTQPQAIAPYRNQQNGLQDNRQQAPGKLDVKAGRHMEDVRQHDRNQCQPQEQCPQQDPG